ncbi:unnamed protein product [Ranitomeya imitator]|uniref:E3 ubiquitin-protein ligase n=1 Tax=Ranitomeya imitator TaxID=111125 RepID=A0ABN9KS41_9NEOB|nr:unnamed protein product [Ranitomeya imitator]
MSTLISAVQWAILDGRVSALTTGEVVEVSSLITVVYSMIRVSCRAKMATPMQEPEELGTESELMGCSARDVALKWLQATDLPKEVYQHLAFYVPKVYCRKADPVTDHEEMLAQHALLGVLEWYLCGEDPATGFPKLEQANKPSQLCGRVFKVGEPTYSCRCFFWV